MLRSFVQILGGRVGEFSKRNKSALDVHRCQITLVDEKTGRAL